MSKKNLVAFASAVIFACLPTASFCMNYQPYKAPKKIAQPLSNAGVLKKSLPYAQTHSVYHAFRDIEPGDELDENNKALKAIEVRMAECWKKLANFDTKNEMYRIKLHDEIHNVTLALRELQEKRDVRIFGLTEIESELYSLKHSFKSKQITSQMLECRQYMETITPGDEGWPRLDEAIKEMEDAITSESVVHSRYLTEANKECFLLRQDYDLKEVLDAIPKYWQALIFIRHDSNDWLRLGEKIKKERAVIDFALSSGAKSPLLSKVNCEIREIERVYALE